jgi:endonuclease YncB( thermonuclease family)
MKNLTIASLLFVLICVCAQPGLAQKIQGAKIKPATPPPTPNAPAPTSTPSKPATEQAGVIQGKVVDLGWGDSLTVLDAQSKQHRVRLLGIDAPEKEQAFGPAARQKLSALVFGKAVTVKYQRMDRNGRPLGKVTLGAVDVNLEMLKAGMAWYYPNDRDLPQSDRPLYSGAEREARAAERGLWQDETPMPPWEFRQVRRQQKPAAPDPDSNSEPSQLATDNGVEKNPDVITDKNTGAPVKGADIASDQGEATTAFPKSPKLAVTGDNSTRTYFKAGCPDGERVLPQNRISFGSVEEAEKAGFKRTPNCP